MKIRFSYSNLYALAVWLFISLYPLLGWSTCLYSNYWASVYALMSINFIPSYFCSSILQYALVAIVSSFFSFVCGYLLKSRSLVLVESRRTAFYPYGSKYSKSLLSLTLCFGTALAFLRLASGSTYHLYSSNQLVTLLYGASIFIFIPLSCSYVQCSRQSNLTMPLWPIYGICLIYIFSGIRIPVIPILFLLFRPHLVANANRLAMVFFLALSIVFIPLTLILRSGSVGFNFLEGYSLLQYPLQPELAIMLFGEFIASSLSAETLIALSHQQFHLIGFIIDSLSLFIPSFLREPSSLQAITFSDSDLTAGGYHLYSQFIYLFGPLGGILFYNIFFFLLGHLLRFVMSPASPLICDLLFTSILFVFPRQNIAFFPKFFLVSFGLVLLIRRLAFVRVLRAD